MKNFNFAKYFQIYYHVDDTSGLNRLFQKKNCSAGCCGAHKVAKHFSRIFLLSFRGFFTYCSTSRFYIAALIYSKDAGFLFQPLF